MFNIFEVTIYVRSLRKVFGNSSERRKKMVGVADASMRVPRPCHPAQSCEPQAATWREARGRGGSFCSLALPNPPAASRGQELPFFSLARQRCVPTPSSLQLQPSRRAPAAPRAPAHRPRQEGRVRSNRSDADLFGVRRVLLAISMRRGKATAPWRTNQQLGRETVLVDCLNTVIFMPVLHG